VPLAFDDRRRRRVAARDEEGQATRTPGAPRAARGSPAAASGEALRGRGAASAAARAAATRRRLPDDLVRGPRRQVSLRARSPPAPPVARGLPPGGDYRGPQSP
jgi:hypothetical protein